MFDNLGRPIELFPGSTDRAGSLVGRHVVLSTAVYKAANVYLSLGSFDRAS